MPRKAFPNGAVVKIKEVERGSSISEELGFPANWESFILFMSEYSRFDCGIAVEGDVRGNNAIEEEIDGQDWIEV